LTYYSKDKLKVDIEYYINNIAQEFPEKLKNKEKALQDDSLLKANMKNLTLNAEKAKSFHSSIIKSVFLVKRARSNLKLSFVFLLI